MIAQISIAISAPRPGGKNQRALYIFSNLSCHCFMCDVHSWRHRHLARPRTIDRPDRKYSIRFEMRLCCCEKITRKRLRQGQRANAGEYNRRDRSRPRLHVMAIYSFTFRPISAARTKSIIDFFPSVFPSDTYNNHPVDIAFERRLLLSLIEFSSVCYVTFLVVPLC